MSLAFEAGLSLSEYYELTPLEFRSFMEGYDNRIRKDYELARFNAYFSIKPHLSRQAANTSMKELIPFEWDVVTKDPVKKISKEEFETLKTNTNWDF